MIKSVWVDNFKSLVDFELELAKFNCIVGLNGSGKSTVLQALDFVSQLMVGDIDGWLKVRQWNSADLNSKLTRKNNIGFKVTLEISGQDVVWSGSFNRSLKICTRESITEDGKEIVSVEDGGFRINTSEQTSGRKIDFKYQGSILSSLKGGRKGNTINEVKDIILNIRSLDLISPELLRKQSRKSEGRLGLGGEKLSALVHESDVDVKESLFVELQKKYPQLDEIRTKSLVSGWKQLEISERFGDKNITSTARHVNDGMLRLMVILLQLEIGNAFLLFDEIENGINPELIEYLIDHLVESEDQVMVTTHSPMVLNFMDDNIAKRGVIYLYKSEMGYTRAIHLFDVPSMAKKLELMGPGEAFIDTDLTQLYREISDMSELES